MVNMDDGMNGMDRMGGINVLVDPEESLEMDHIPNNMDIFESFLGSDYRWR